MSSKWRACAIRERFYVLLLLDMGKVWALDPSDIYYVAARSAWKSLQQGENDISSRYLMSLAFQHSCMVHVSLDRTPVAERSVSGTSEHPKTYR